jgi:site-specific DNA-methyltransferase (adenine-specific)
MGRGTTGVECKNLNRNFIGIELDEQYFVLASKRISKTQNTIDLFFL